MINFKHINAASTDDALSALGRYGEGARVLAGGQDLLFRIKKYIVQPKCVINLKTIPGLSDIRSKPDENLRIGALTTLSQLARSAELQRLAGGDSRYYGSVMGGHLCLSNHPSDTAVALAALDARVHIVSPNGRRVAPIGDFLCGHNWVGGRLQSHTLGLDEIVTEIEVPLRPTHSRYVKFALRKSWDFAIASVAVSAVIRDHICEDLRIVLGGVATFPYRNHEAEKLLKNREIDDASAGAAAEAALENARPLKMNGYKVELSKTLVRRALLSLGD
ncbi:MAG: FAD binding domain-containing protein [Deltaproteobacteria bacterium]|nr:FAD binding domain-containing protein [Deltaproteobacteria bacterium]